MFKGFKKVNLSNPVTFWRYAVTVFGFCLALIFIGQTIVMFVVEEQSLGQTVTIPNDNLGTGLDPKKVNQLLKELGDRPGRSSEALSTTTLFVDPSL